MGRSLILSFLIISIVFYAMGQPKENVGKIDYVNSVKNHDFSIKSFEKQFSNVLKPRKKSQTKEQNEAGLHGVKTKQMSSLATDYAPKAPISNLITPPTNNVPAKEMLVTMTLPIAKPVNKTAPSPLPLMATAQQTVKTRQRKPSFKLSKLPSYLPLNEIAEKTVTQKKSRIQTANGKGSDVKVARIHPQNLEHDFMDFKPIDHIYTGSQTATQEKQEKQNPMPVKKLELAALPQPAIETISSTPKTKSVTAPQLASKTETKAVIASQNNENRPLLITALPVKRVIQSSQNITKTVPLPVKLTRNLQTKSSPVSAPVSTMKMAATTPTKTPIIAHNTVSKPQHQAKRKRPKIRIRKKRRKLLVRQKRRALIEKQNALRRQRLRKQLRLTQRTIKIKKQRLRTRARTRKYTSIKKRARAKLKTRIKNKAIVRLRPKVRARSKKKRLARKRRKSRAARSLQLALIKKRNARNQARFDKNLNRVNKRNARLANRKRLLRRKLQKQRRAARQRVLARKKTRRRVVKYTKSNTSDAATRASKRALQRKMTALKKKSFRRKIRSKRNLSRQKRRTLAKNKEILRKIDKKLGRKYRKKRTVTTAQRRKRNKARRNLARKEKQVAKRAARKRAARVRTSAARKARKVRRTRKAKARQRRKKIRVARRIRRPAKKVFGIFNFDGTLDD